MASVQFGMTVRVKIRGQFFEIYKYVLKLTKHLFSNMF